MIKERNTKQKMLILNAVRSVCTHPTAEQVYEMISGEMPGLSLGTVYRNLNRMAELGQLRRISVTNSPDRFDGNMNPHHHICCVECGEFGDRFDLKYDESLDATAEKKSGYKIIKHETVFYGVCKNCKTKVIN